MKSILVIMTWQDYFADVVLERGLEYYNEDRVKIISHSSSKVKAFVIGYQKYNVSINLETNECYCDCRYGGKCKHLAATFYYLDNHPKSNNDYSDILSNFSYEELATFLETELPQNPELLFKLKTFKKQDMGDEYYMDKLNESFKSPVNVINFINEELMFLNNIDLKLSMMNLIVDYLDELNYDGMYDAYDDVFENLERLIKKALINHQDKVCEFLAFHIINSEDERVSDNFAVIYGEYGDVDKLFE